MTRVGAWLLVVLAAVLVLAVGCGTSTDEPAPPVQVVAPAEEPAPPIAVPAEYELSIGRIGVTRASIAEVGLNPDRTLQAPPLDDPGLVGVFKYGPMPGERGPAALLGHVNSRGKQGVFARLADLRDGDGITVNTPRGPVAFTVYRTLSVLKERFPSSAVWSDTAGPELRLITCGPGELDSSGHSYVSQTIVFARAA